MTGMIDNKGEFHEINFYNIQGLCEAMTDAAINNDELLCQDYEENFKKKLTRFSPEFEFCLHRLGWKLYDPFCLGGKDVLTSNGEVSFLSLAETVVNPEFDRYAVKNPRSSYPKLTDELLGYQADLKTLTEMETGLVDEKGYIRASETVGLNNLARLTWMFKMMNSKEAYEYYMEHRHEYESSLDFYADYKNEVVVKNLRNGTYSLRFASENDGEVKEFVERLEREGKIAEMPIAVATTQSLMTK